MTLARSREPGDRERLLTGIIDLCEANQASGQPAHPDIQALLNSIFMTLVVEAERDIRRRLSERLADAGWAPPALVNIMASIPKKDGGSRTVAIASTSYRL